MIKGTPPVVAMRIAGSGTGLCSLRSRLGLPGTAMLLMLLAVCLLTQSGIASAQADAFSVEVAVADRGVAEQQDAYVSAFRRVLLNNSGDKTLLNRDDVREGLKQAEQYVSGFSYRTPPPGTVISSDTPITEAVRESGQATQLMLVTFDRQSVLQLIEGQPAAGRDEEPVAAPLRTDSALVWLLVQDDGRDIMISDPAAANVQARAREIAGAAGVSLVFPAGDEEDQLALGLEDLLVKDVTRIAAASERYAQDTVLFGTLARNGAQGWRSTWVRMLGENQQEQNFDTASLDEALKRGLSLLSDTGRIDESYRYGGQAVSDTEALVWVGSLNSTSDYATMMRFLEELPSVSTVYPKEISDTSMVFAVLPRSALTDVESALVTQNWLRRTAPPVSDRPDSLSQNADLALEFGR
ncbi:DUF2066 domain-containing protein [Granulosicoccus sp. 3-233]|uniref:DUF2066 domain-containing protein n=1 Tax=Granulosicoccus sp. 3-233 TaxID=3417969 RepID=UPI003D327BE1